MQQTMLTFYVKIEIKLYLKTFLFLRRFHFFLEIPILENEISAFFLKILTFLHLSLISYESFRL